MGGDGGSVIQRIDMVRTKGYASAQPSSRGGMGYQPNSVRRVETETVDPKQLRKLAMRNCALTQQPLDGHPVAACRAGYLFRKEAVLSALLEKKLPLKFQHITSIKDLVNVKASFPFVCPITSRELDDGVTRAVVFWPCGCLTSRKAAKMAKGSSLCCNCQVPYTLEVSLFPPVEERDSQLRVAMELRTRKDQPKTEDKKRKIIEPPEPPTKKSQVFEKIFHDPKTKVEKTDAFGRAYSSKGVGI